MDALEKVNREIWREQACIDDLLSEIKIHVQEGRISLAKQREQDLHNSLNQLEKLYERKRLWVTVEELNNDGILTKVVKKVVEMVR